MTKQKGYTLQMLASALDLREIAPEIPEECVEIIRRMKKGGYSICTIASTEVNLKKLFSVTFLKGDEEIHVTGQQDITKLFQAALAEAHRRYREGVQSQSRDAGSLGAGDQSRG